MRVSSVIPLFLALASLSTNVLAQQSNGGGNTAPANTGAGDQPSRTGNSNPAATNPPSNNNNNNNNEDNTPEENSASGGNQDSNTNRPNGSQTQNTPPAKTTNNSDDSKDNKDNEKEPPSKTTNNSPVITGSGDDEKLDAPAISSGSDVTISQNVPSGTNDPELPPPKYTPPDNGRYTIPDYPPPAVPNTKNAPYMQTSDLPEGTVFIAVGAALGLLGFIAFAWRMVVAWQLRRSIRKANLAATSDSKAGLLGRFDAPSTAKKSFYSAGAGSSVSLDHLGNSRTGLGQTPNTSLFFSPTANTGSPVHANRGSAYLPAGYYAPAGSPGLGFNQSRDSLPRPRPATRDSPAHGTPPASPLLMPQARRPSPGQGGHHQSASVSSRTSLGVQPGGRTPSTYLEDMLDVPLPEDSGMTAEQAKRSSRRKSGHSYYGNSGSRR